MKVVNDKYFTKPSFVKKCLEYIDFSDFQLILEPSAGCGSFLARLPVHKRVGIDISPDISEVIQLDFFNLKKVIKILDLKTNPDKKYLSVGNPPFGYMCSLAIGFFNDCALFSDTIAFILPRTFRKRSIINRLDDNFHMKEELLAPKDSFLVLDPASDNLIKECDVPCVFQIWERQPNKRKKLLPKLKSDYFDFTNNSQADIAIRRVGVKAGLLYPVSSSKQSHYFIKLKEQSYKGVFENIVWDYCSAKYDTVGNPSISKEELVKEFEKTLDKSN